MLDIWAVRDEQPTRNDIHPPLHHKSRWHLAGSNVAFIKYYKVLYLVDIIMPLYLGNMSNILQSLNVSKCLCSHFHICNTMTLTYNSHIDHTNKMTLMCFMLMPYSCHMTMAQNEVMKNK